MEWIELPSLGSVGEGIVWDRTLLELAEQDPVELGEGWLWFYENKEPCVVIGYGQKAENEANVNDCDALGIQILRRCSGGGTVLLGPGCLAYGLILPIPESGPLSSITGTNQWIMERQRIAWSHLLPEPVVVRGHTDLAVVRNGQERKFSGNAQRRKRRTVLFHGTALLNMDLSLIYRVLRPPSWAPEYRSGRKHVDFVTNVGAPIEKAKEAIVREWGAQRSGRRLDRERWLLEPEGRNVLDG